MVDLFTEDVADFTAFDASLTSGYADDVQDLISYSRGYATVTKRC